MNKIPLGVSQCLLGEQVRFDGGHKRNTYLMDELAQYVEYRSHCPEVAIGLGIPRKPIRLIVTDGSTRVRGVADTTLDVTDKLVEYAEQAAAQLGDICGYVFMQNSPSCGVFGMKRYRENGYSMDAKGRGAYAQRLMELMPLLPVEEAGRLNDAGLRDNFLTRVFALYDWRQKVAPDPSAKKLIEFYSRYKYQVMAHHVPSYFAIGKFLANLAGRNIDDSCAEFLRMFMTALTHLAGRKGNTNAMMHLRGYLKLQISSQEKQELSHLIESYQAGLVPLVVPLTLLKHHLLKLDNPYLKSRTFWSPHPERLGLRNHITECK
jgi:uncharacterized protein YbgA (DUF1722 family)/uncharacterized protein YbbK (DUF523 family)